MSGLTLTAWCVSRGAVALLAVTAVAGCGTSGAYRLPLMPAPDIHAEQIVDPFADLGPVEIEDGDAGIIYVTNRERDGGDDAVRYTSKRGYLLRAGTAKVRLGDGDYTWDELRQISLLKNRTEDFPLEVYAIDEFGVLPESVTPLQDPADVGADPDATERLVARMQEQLDRSVLKDITIYVHGYKVVFENPVLVAAELWHYLGYQGAFMAFSWPATPKRTAYFSDSSNAAYSAAQFRRLLTLLAERTSAERINIIGYSAGTRVVVGAVDQLNLLARYAPPELRERYLRIGHVILVGADADRDNFARILGDGVLEVVEDFTVYTNARDRALGFSRWLLAGQNRLGQTMAAEEMTAAGIRFVAANPSLRFINVTEAEASGAANGHGYFRASPWVSGDILMTLRYGLAPADRGLVLQADRPAWQFPPDYLERLRRAFDAARAVGLPPSAAGARPARATRNQGPGGPLVRSTEPGAATRSRR